MITNYNVDYENNETIIIITLDFNYEISDFNIKNNIIDLKKNIYTLAHKVHANKIKIIVNGILISTLLLQPISIKENNHIPLYVTKDTIKNNFNIIKIEKETNINTPNNIVTKEKENIKNNIDVPVKIPNNNNLTNKTDNNEIIKNVESKDNKEKINIINVQIHRSNGTILNIDLENYIIGVVASEMPASFHIEALKAQAIVARTYALKRISENKILTDDVSTQRFKDNNELKNMWGKDFDKYYNKIKNAVNSTKDYVLKYNNKYIDAVYHSTSNGYTEDAAYVWGYSIPYLKSVESKYDLNVSSYEKEKIFTFEEISKLLNTKVNKDTDFILERNNSNRVILVKVNDIEINGITFRNLLNLRSTDFKITITNENIIFTTYGYGHGVGMSQYGANSMAKSGYNHMQILNHYYQNVTLTKK